MATVPARAAARWDGADLVRRVVGALDAADRAVGVLVEGEAAAAELAIAPAPAAHLAQKVVAETAMLLLCVEPARHLDERIRARADAVARRIVPHARHQDVLAAVCLDPGLAVDHAFAHILLGRLGYRDDGVDRLLAATLATGGDSGPERLPHRRLEQAWLRRVRQAGTPSSLSDARLVADSMLGRPLDALGATRIDLYAFTHAVMYASDLGERRLALPRSRRAVAADADAALAHALDAGDFDLTAELLLTWPMLGLRWSAAATFAFGVLAAVEDELGFLPGSSFDRARYEAMNGADRAAYALATCYHTTYVMGFLCAAALRPGCAPPAAVAPGRRSGGAAAAILRLADGRGPSPCWRAPLAALSRSRQDALAPLLLAVVLRRARAAGDLALVREALEAALAHGLVAAPAPMQAAALLRRSQALRLSLAGG